MWKRGAEETKNEVKNQKNCQNQSVKTEMEPQTQHPYAFHVSGPRNVPSINWRDLINSSWLVPPNSLIFHSHDVCVCVFLIKLVS